MEIKGVGKSPANKADDFLTPFKRSPNRNNMIMNMQIKVGLVIGCNKICINNIFSVAAGEI